MWLHRCVFILFPYIVNCLHLSLQDNVQVRPRSEDTELIFTDVIKNISRVNNVLEELINNYEQLKKMYKSEEKSETIESDTEIDEVFKAKAERKNKSKTTEKPPHTGEFPATQMFWSDDDEHSANLANKKSKSSKKITSANDTAKKSSENSSSDHSIADSSDISSEKEKMNHKTKETKPALRKNPEIFTINIQTTTKNPTEITKNIMDPILQATSKAIGSKIINVKDKTTNNTRNVHKVVRAESFSKDNIWNEIFNKKPIQLQKSHVAYDLAQKPVIEMKQANLRSSYSKPRVAQAIKNNTKTDENLEANFDQTEDEVVIQKEQFKTDVLRTAYGDACLKLVVTKCNRACTAAGKSACRKFNCKADFKEKFKSSARTGCRKKFRGEDLNDTKTKKTKKDLYYRGKQQESDNGDFVDMTRGGFISGACLPPSQDKPGNGTQVPSKSRPDKITILRDRYETACKKISAGKCKKACFYAYQTACNDSCDSAKKTAFRKACKKECSSVYKLSHDDDDSDYYSDSE